MAPSPLIVALGVVDAERLTGTAGVTRSWTSLGVASPGGGRTFRAVFDRTDETFRRLDRISRALVLAGEAAGITAAIAAARATPAEVGIVFETSLGSLDSDLRFAASMAAGMCDGPVFAYTLPSTSLGELALRHGLRGPTVCLATVPSQRGAALREAALLLATGECDVVVAGIVDVLASPRPSVEPECRAIVAVLVRAASDLPRTSCTVAAWPGVDSNSADSNSTSDPWEQLAAALPRP
jgi:3-oxoacyl-(acyl-carrier-protein) synthase